MTGRPVAAMIDVSLPLEVRCRFGECDHVTQLRVVLATVDQLCAATDISLALLESLEVPLGEVMASLWPYGVDSVLVGVTDDELHLSIELRDPPPSRGLELLGDDDGLIEAFFAVGDGATDSEIELVGSIG